MEHNANKIWYAALATITILFFFEITVKRRLFEIEKRILLFIMLLFGTQKRE